MTMKPNVRSLGILAICAAAALLCGCGTFRDTVPSRSASEQVLLSTAADRAIEEMADNWIRNTRVLIDTSQLDAYDQEYLVQRLRRAVLYRGGILVDDSQQADAVLEVASGGFSIDTGRFAIGIPEITLPVPFAGQLELPEIAFFKQMRHVGKAKILFTVLDPKSGRQYVDVPICYGRSRRTLWWIFFIGPFDTSDIPDPMR